MKPWLVRGAPCAICAFIALLMGVWFALVIPADSEQLPMRLRGLNPDERDHVLYAQKLRATGALVRFPAEQIRAARAGGGEEGKELREFAETHQPPLYYALGAMLGGSLLALRLLSALFAAATAALAFLAARELLPERAEVAWGAALFMGLLPAAAQLGGAASNDAAATLVCTGVLWRLARLLKGGMTTRDALVLGAWLGAGFWVKLTALQLFPLALVAAFLAPDRPLKRTVTALGLALLIASPWLIRNTLLYGDPLNLGIFPLTAPLTTPTPASMQAIEPLGLTPWRYGWLVAWRSFATFHYLLPPMTLWPATGPALLFVLLGAAALVGAFKSPPRRLVLLCLAAPLTLAPFFLSFNLRFFQAQGRYFHPALFAVALLVALGVSQLAGERRRGWAIAALSVVLFLLSALQAVSLCQAL